MQTAYPSIFIYLFIFYDGLTEVSVLCTMTEYMNLKVHWQYQLYESLFHIVSNKSRLQVVKKWTNGNCSLHVEVAKAQVTELKVVLPPQRRQFYTGRRKFVC